MSWGRFWTPPWKMPRRTYARAAAAVKPTAKRARATKKQAKLEEAKNLESVARAVQQSTEAAAVSRCSELKRAQRLATATVDCCRAAAADPTSGQRTVGDAPASSSAEKLSGVPQSTCDSRKVSPTATTSKTLPAAVYSYARPQKRPSSHSVKATRDAIAKLLNG